MKSKTNAFYQAMLTRDARFDGKFFIGVKTTGIYCRPICPARPEFKNVEFFPNAPAAEKAGYRPCLRCRPECAPLSPAWIGKSAVVNRALKLIADNRLLDSNEDEFAALLGVTARHLRRLFEEELGKTPKQISDLNRLDFARKLLTESSLPVTDIAFASGFSSVRRFNDAMKKRFHRAPSLLRRAKVDPRLGKGIHLMLAYRPPLDWPSLMHFFGAHAVSGVEAARDGAYERIFKLGGTLGGLRLSHSPDRPVLAALVLKYPGLRVPRGWDAFETSICSILGQLVSTEQARRLMRQLVETHGEKVVNPFSGEVAYLFPDAKSLAGARLDCLGTTKGRKQAIREFCAALVAGKFSLEPTQDPSEFRKSLLAIKGIGVWTAEYIALRALGDTDAFPRTDLILRRATQLHPELDLEGFKPRRAYAAMYLWKEYAAPLSKKGKKSDATLL